MLLNCWFNNSGVPLEGKRRGKHEKEKKTKVLQEARRALT